MLDYYRPKYFVLENVQKIHTISGGKLLNEMKEALRDIGNGYHLTTWELLASDYGLPQKRRKVSSQQLNPPSKKKIRKKIIFCAINFSFIYLHISKLLLTFASQ